MKFWFSGDIILFPDEYNSILIRTEINNPKIRFPVLEGDKLMKEVLNGGYNVHPVPPPNSEINSCDKIATV